MDRIKSALIWVALLAAITVPVLASLMSPLLAWRDTVYIAAGLAGVFAMTLLLVQPLLVAGSVPGIPRPSGRQVHRWIGIGLVTLVVVHVLGLWITSPPDVIDALLFRSPTPFSAWGVIAMVCVFAAALLAALRRRLKLPPRIWRRLHSSLAVVVVAGSIVHALLIEGTMEPISKTVLCILAALATLRTLIALRIWGKGAPKKTA